jgi:cell division transport system ATP-binding protein
MIEFSGVSLSYPRTGAVLRDVHWELGAGELAVISGPSGSGKTSLLRLLSGQVGASTGAVRLFGRNIGKLRASSLVALRRLIGIVPQEIQLFDEQTVFDNIAVSLEIAARPRAEIRTQVEYTLARLGLLDMSSMMAGQLSTGQRRRVAIARALARGPSILLADEPTGDLDDNWTQLLLEYIVELRSQGLTAMLTTHDERVHAALSPYRWWHYELREGNLINRAATAFGELQAEPTVENIVPFPVAARAAGVCE